MPKPYILKCSIIIDVFDDEDVDDVANTVQRDIAESTGYPIILDDVEEYGDE
jgi:hypothetical protein